ncbi:MAG: GSU2403 family nucleotidyltransferase fold protein [Candidatus Margulisiibacteriota bacterium]
MEKNQYDLCLEILKRLSQKEILDKIILIGSWCLPFYKQYFHGIEYISTIKTRDLDFLIPNPSSIKNKVDIPELLKDLGFIVGFKGSKGDIILRHPDLMVEFLVIEKGKGSDEPFPLPKLGVNAVGLRFLSFLTLNVIKVKINNIELALPHPANFALHKLIISQRRKNRDKKEKDLAAALNVIKALIKKKENNYLRKAFNSVPEKWQSRIIKELEKHKEDEIIEILRGEE